MNTVGLFAGVAVSTGVFLLTGWLHGFAYKWIVQDIRFDLVQINRLHARLLNGRRGEDRDGN